MSPIFEILLSCFWFVTNEWIASTTTIKLSCSFAVDANSRHIGALRQISECYYSGQGVEQDEQQGNLYFDKCVEACKELIDKVIPPEHPEQEEERQNIISQQNIKTLIKLAKHYESKNNLEQAFKLYQIAADKGDPEALLKLAEARKSFGETALS
jgi:TPR repeat protein